MNEELKLTHPAAKLEVKGPTLPEREILIISSRKATSIIPIPGRTTLDGRKVPSALESTIFNRLVIQPMERAQPPLYVERSFEHNFVLAVGKVLGMGTVTLQKIESDVTQRRLRIARFSQALEDAIVNGEEGQDIATAVTLIGIEGELQDHLLTLRYARRLTSADPELDREVEALSSLVDSFRPLRELEPDEKREELRTIADENFQRLMAEKGEEIFGTEFGLLLRRLAGENLDDPNTRLRGCADRRVANMSNEGRTAV